MALFQIEAQITIAALVVCAMAVGWPTIWIEAPSLLALAWAALARKSSWSKVDARPDIPLERGVYLW